MQNLDALSTEIITAIDAASSLPELEAVRIDVPVSYTHLTLPTILRV